MRNNLNTIIRRRAPLWEQFWANFNLINILLWFKTSSLLFFSKENSHQNGTYQSTLYIQNCQGFVYHLNKSLFKWRNNKCERQTGDAWWHFFPLPVPKCLLGGRFIALIALSWKCFQTGGDVQTKCVPGNMARADSLIFKGCLSALQKKKQKTYKQQKQQNLIKPQFKIFLRSCLKLQEINIRQESDFAVRATMKMCRYWHARRRHLGVVFSFCCRWYKKKLKKQRQFP